jgi:hypothetical protein
MRVYKVLRTVLFLAVTLFAAGSARLARADTIDLFTISGTWAYSCVDPTGQPILGCTPTSEGFAGDLGVDVTTGTVMSMDVLFPNGNAISEYSTAIQGFAHPSVFPAENGMEIQLGNPYFSYLQLVFTTATPGSLVGFDGGTILSGDNLSGVYDLGLFKFWNILGGSITPVTPTQTPEPSALGLILLGLAGCSLLVLRKAKIERQTARCRQAAV